MLALGKVAGEGVDNAGNGLLHLERVRRPGSLLTGWGNETMYTCTKGEREKCRSEID